MSENHITLAHGSGGIRSRELVRDRLLNFFTSPLLGALDESALDVESSFLEVDPNG
mgnify:CR=1 FL=1